MKIGDYVTARLLNANEDRQGVYVADNSDGTIRVCGETGNYQCIKSAVTVVPDVNLAGSTMAFVNGIRRLLRREP